MARPTRTNPIPAATGAALGAMAGPFGAAAGGLLGAILGTDPVPLDVALLALFAERGYTLMSAGLENSSLYAVSFRYGDGMYWRLTLPATRQKDEELGAFEDRIYDDVKKTLDDWRSKNAPGVKAP